MSLDIRGVGFLSLRHMICVMLAMLGRSLRTLILADRMCVMFVNVG